jgi:hypothetical protein
MQEFGFTLRVLGHFVRLEETQPHNPAERRACVEAKLAAVFLKHIPAEAATLYFKSDAKLACRRDTVDWLNKFRLKLIG